MSELVTTYKCADGTEFPVRWEREGDASLTWGLEDNHWPGPLRPIDAAVWEGTAARERAFSEAGLPTPSWLPRFLAPHGFVYRQRAEFPDEGVDDLVRRWGGVADVWEEHCRPWVQEACTRLQMAGDDEPVADLLEVCDYAWAKTMVAAVVVISAYRRLSGFLNELFGPEAEAWTATLTQGYPNATVDAAQAQWELAQIASRSAEMRELIVDAELSSVQQALRQVEGGREFLSAFDDFLLRFGWRSEGWEAGLPTWRERPERPLGVIRRMITDGTASPGLALDEVARRRQELTSDIEDRLRNDVAKLAELHERLSAVTPYLSVREDRALWQLNAFGSLRSALLRRGDKMVRSGSIGRAEDILYLRPEEIERRGSARGDLLEVVEERKREWQRWSRLTPPANIGAVETSTQLEGAGEAAEGEVRGMAASRGVVTGPARIIRDLSEADKLMPGDVLVCRTTSPPWTVLFARASAVVADAGGVLAHTAITAREYGIPCVVGARGATERIRDGMLVTVDGDEGVVRLSG